jgi:hypothetical protein
MYCFRISVSNDMLLYDLLRCSSVFDLALLTNVCLCLICCIEGLMNILVTMYLAMKAQRGNRGIALFILNFSARGKWMVTVTPWLLYTQEGASVPIIQELGWAPGPVRVVVEKRKTLVSTGG